MRVKENYFKNLHRKLNSSIPKFYMFVCLLVFCALVSDEYKLINSIPFSNATFITSDKLGNVYVVIENQLLQFDPRGKPLANYSETNLGSLQYVDAGNPMKILLFYPDFARIIILDSKLSPQSTIDLRTLNINQPIVACNSKEDGYWVYDREDDQLKKIDLNLQIVQQSGNLTQQVGYQMQPTLMTEENGLVYINNPSNGILVFDRFGTYYKTIPYPNLKNFQVIENDVLFINNNKLLRYDSKTIEEKQILLPYKDSIVSARIEQHQLYLLTSDSLNFYSF